MALSDWTQYGDTSNLYASTAYAYAGSQSLSIDGDAVDDQRHIIYAPSETDAPGEAEVTYQFTSDSEFGHQNLLFLFHWQDANNFVFFETDNEANGGSGHRIGYYDSGNLTVLQSTNDYLVTTSYNAGSWGQMNAKLYQDSAGDYVIEATGPNNTLGVSTSTLPTNGGGVGIGQFGSSRAKSGAAPSKQHADELTVSY